MRPLGMHSHPIPLPFLLSATDNLYGPCAQVVRIQDMTQQSWANAGHALHDSGATEADEKNLLVDSSTANFRSSLAILV